MFEYIYIDGSLLVFVSQPVVTILLITPKRSLCLVHSVFVRRYCRFVIIIIIIIKIIIMRTSPEKVYIKYSCRKFYNTLLIHEYHKNRCLQNNSRYILYTYNLYYKDIMYMYMMPSLFILIKVLEQTSGIKLSKYIICINVLYNQFHQYIFCVIYRHKY